MTIDEQPAVDAPPGPAPLGADVSGVRRSGVAAGAGAGAMTMVALCFANGLQLGGAQTFAQAIDSIKATYHVSDFVIGIIPFCVGIAGNVGAVPIAQLCARYRRTRVLAAMFLGWGLLFALTGLVPDMRLFGFAAAGFVLFAILRVASSTLEATDPAALPLIADWWPVQVRGRQVSIFNAGAAVGAITAIIGSGVLIDDVGWRWSFVVWLPIALVGAHLIRHRREPARGAQDAAYAGNLEAVTTGSEHDMVVEIVENEAEIIAAAEAEQHPEVGWSRAVVRAVSRLRSWRMVVIGITVTGFAAGGLGTWGLTYFKRTFHLSAVQVGALVPLVGAGGFVGVLAGGFLTDRMLRRGMVRARVVLTAVGFAGAGLLYFMAFTTTRLALAAPLLGIGATLAALPTGPMYAVMMDVVPSPLRSQASAAANVLMACGAVGSLVTGGLSTLLGSLRLALLAVSPFYLLGAVLVAVACRTYVSDVAVVVAEARGSTEKAPSSFRQPEDV
jgi:MFS family permease